MQLRHTLPVATAIALLTGCSSDSDHDFDATTAERLQNAAMVAPSQLVFDPAASEIPFPNSLLFSGSQDGTLNIPVADPENLSDPTIALNQLDGFSTTSPIVAGLSRAVDPASVELGTNVRVFEVVTSTDPATAGAVLQVVAELGATDVVVVPQESQLAILPLQPLKEKTDYMVIITNGIMGANGAPVEASVPYRLARGSISLADGPAAALEPVRGLTNSQLAAAAAFDETITANTTVLSWTFKTQSIRDVLQAVENNVGAGALNVAPAGITTTGVVPTLPGRADVYIGTLDIPYYQTAVSAGDPSTIGAALNSFWTGANGLPVSQFNPAPASTGTETIPVFMTVPNATSASGGVQPANGWPIVIFQHGITRNRLDAVAVADAMADAGFAVIAIDIPMHGLTDNTLALHADNSPFPTDRERTFGIDVLNNDELSAGPDGVEDPSGAHFYNLANLANSRDNFRQGVADLMVLSASLPSIGGIALDTGRKGYIGHSLGGILGATFLSYDDTFTSATLAMPGGGIAQLLANSGSFGPVIAGGVAGAANTTPDAPEFPAIFAEFLSAAQTVIDSGDPINHAQTLAGNGTPVHLIQVRDDGTIPNSVATAPLAGTEPLGRQLGLMNITGSTNMGGVVIFDAANATHGSIIDPGETAETLAVTVEMQQQTATFLASQGTVLPINNPAVIESAGETP